MSHGLITLPSNNSGTHSLGVCLARDRLFKDGFISLPLLSAAGSCQPRKVFPELQNCWAWSAQGWLVPGPLHWDFFCWVTSLYVIQASSPASCCSSFSSSSKNAPSSDLGHLSRCENCSTHLTMSIVVKAALEFQVGFSGLMPLACWVFLVPFCSSQTPDFQLSSSGPAAVVTLEGREGWDPYWKWNKQSDFLLTVG